MGGAFSYERGTPVPPRGGSPGGRVGTDQLVPTPVAQELPAREFFISNLLVRIHFIIVMITWTGLAPWKFETPFPGSLTFTFLEMRETLIGTYSRPFPRGLRRSIRGGYERSTCFFIHAIGRWRLGKHSHERYSPNPSCTRVWNAATKIFISPLCIPFFKRKFIEHNTAAMGPPPPTEAPCAKHDPHLQGYLVHKKPPPPLGPP